MLLQALCKRTAMPVALKIYFLDRIPGNTLHQIAREIQIQVNLAHRNILGLYGAFQDSKRLVLVLELAGRGDLHRLHTAMDRPLNEEQLRGAVLEPLLDALSYLHTRGICHRDIKPENLLYASDWALRVADFGVAINITEERAVTRAGTADYMAPEVERCPLKSAPADNKDDLSLAYSTAADVWSVGVLAYEMLVGFPPVLTAATKGGAGAPDSGRSGATPQLSFPASVSAAARDFITSALALRPEDRPTVQQLRAHPWMTGAAGAQGTGTRASITRVSPSQGHAAPTEGTRHE
ncbi:hypothetical protein GPECTOR_17g908 [Gonium pectorale]|uniref:Protein kinase domain-containing protein n=1 Tax=Gonium pectorale TaxID=33097 RepID=A0A150GK98_GONPE|nr:hypothetical protein GPECTOR_17g908 [Gonium pectorale]|eukprot:KXZ50269.1 hypothetical protein GPECTOR_17g908 [Gonium pectorale]